VDAGCCRDAQPKRLRWFSPTTELTLCGSGTLAAAHILGGDQTFQTRGGTLPCTVGSDGAINMRFPADPPRPEPQPAELAEGLPSITVRSVWRGRHDVLVEAELLAEQASPRGGLLRTRLDGDHVVLIRHAVTVCSGNLHV
jgi:hypothetical protein